MASGIFSVVKDPKSCFVLPEVLLDRRIIIPSHERLINELSFLEWDALKEKVDHPPKKSKNLSGCLAGVKYNLSMGREIWCREYDIFSRDADLFLRLGSGESTSFENVNLADLNKQQSAKDAIFSGEGIVTSDKDHSVLTDLGFVEIVLIGRALKKTSSMPRGF